MVARKNAGTFRPSVVNHSGFLYPWDGDSYILMNAVRDVVYQNVPYFTSANNFSGDACGFTPASYAYTRTNKHWTRVVFSVGGMTMDGGVVTQDGRVRMTGTGDITWKIPPAVWDQGNAQQRVRDTGTNLGACVSAFAPAVHITAAAHGILESSVADPNYYRAPWKSGTSWSSPLAAAVALRWMATQPTNIYYTYVYDFLLNTGLKVVTAQPNAAYTICYNPSNVNEWIYYTDPNAECFTAWGTYRMPASDNVSDARMIYWQGNGICQ